MAASDEDQDRDGSEAKPLLASQDSDLTLPPQTFVHGDFCSMHARIPNEEWDAGVCVCVCVCVWLHVPNRCRRMRVVAVCARVERVKPWSLRNCFALQNSLSCLGFGVVHGYTCLSHAIFEYSGEAAAGLYQSCEFEGQTSWVRKRGVSDAYRHGQIAKSHYGLGTIVTIFADMD